MSYTAKRLILLLMAWGLVVFAGITVRINMSAPHPLPGTPTPGATVAPTAAADAAAARADQLQQVLQQNPNDLASLIELGAIFYQAKDWDNAILIDQRAAALDPQNVDLRVQLAAAQLYGLRFSQARATLDQVATLAPRRADIHLLLGLALSRQTPPDRARAVAEWQRVLTLAPGTDLARQAQALIAGGAGPTN